MRRVFSAFRARQGGHGQRILLVLLISLVLACAAWFAVETYGTSIETDRTLQTQPAS